MPASQHCVGGRLEKMGGGGGNCNARIVTGMTI